MENRKQYLERQLIANVIKDKCAHCDDVLFEESWCTQELCIRFTLPIFRAIFPPRQGVGEWGSGDFVMFEIHNSSDRFEITCVVSDQMPKEYKNARTTLLTTFPCIGHCIIWEGRCHSLQPETIFDFFDEFLSVELPTLEKQVLAAFLSPITEETLEEGTAKKINSTRYERNRKARGLCLSYYGRACKRCGLNFGEKYGAKYADLIEVHHIVPISEIGSAYIVNPIRDLIPLCPNCHAITHCDLRC